MKTIIKRELDGDNPAGATHDWVLRDHDDAGTFATRAEAREMLKSIKEYGETK